MGISKAAGQQTLKPFSSTKDICAFLGISRRTWYRLLQSERAPRPIKVGRSNRWRQGDIEAWLDRGENSDAHAR